MAKRGRKPISEALKARILEVYGRTQSSRKTADECGVHRKTVQNVTSGRHGQIVSESVSLLNPGEVYVVAQRCRGCGHLVEVLTAAGQCRECLAAKLIEARRVLGRLRQVLAQTRTRAALHSNPARPQESKCDGHGNSFNNPQC